MGSKKYATLTFLRSLELMERDGSKFERLENYRSSFHLARKKGSFEATPKTVVITKLRK